MHQRMRIRVGIDAAMLDQSPLQRRGVAPEQRALYEVAHEAAEQAERGGLGQVEMCEEIQGRRRAWRPDSTARQASGEGVRCHPLHRSTPAPCNLSSAAA